MTVAKQGESIQRMEANIQAFQAETSKQISQLAASVAELKSEKGTLPSQTVANPKASLCSVTLSSGERAESSTGRYQGDSVPDQSAVSTLNTAAVSYTAGLYIPDTAAKHMIVKSAKPKKEDYWSRPAPNTGINSDIKDNCGRLTTLVSQVSIRETTPDYYSDPDYDQPFALPRPRWIRKWTPEGSPEKPIEEESDSDEPFCVPRRRKKVESNPMELSDEDEQHERHKSGMRDCRHERKERAVGRADDHIVLPRKKEDPGDFLVELKIGSKRYWNCLLDTGSSLNILPFQYYRELGLGTLTPCEGGIELADQSTMYPRGQIDNVLVWVHGCAVLVDFIVVDMKPIGRIPPQLILGREFMDTVGLDLSIRSRTITMEMPGQTLIMDRRGRLLRRIEETPRGPPRRGPMRSCNARVFKGLFSSKHPS